MFALNIPAVTVCYITAVSAGEKVPPPPYGIVRGDGLMVFNSPAAGRDAATLLVDSRYTSNSKYLLLVFTVKCPVHYCHLHRIMGILYDITHYLQNAAVY